MLPILLKLLGWDRGTFLEAVSAVKDKEVTVMFCHSQHIGTIVNVEENSIWLETKSTTYPIEIEANMIEKLSFFPNLSVNHDSKNVYSDT